MQKVFSLDPPSVKTDSNKTTLSRKMSAGVGKMVQFKTVETAVTEHVSDAIQERIASVQN